MAQQQFLEPECVWFIWAAILYLQKSLLPEMNTIHPLCPPCNL